MLTPAFDFETFPTLETPRLILRELVPEDAEAVFAFRSDYTVTRLNIGRAYETLDEAEMLIYNIRRNFRDKRELRWAITLRGQPQVIGLCGYNFWLRQDYRASIGYDLARPHWGKGIMTEALRAVIAFGFGQMALNRIEADTSAENYASARVLEKLGFQREGIQREQYFEGGEFHDLILYALLRRDFILSNQAAVETTVRLRE